MNLNEEATTKCTDGYALIDVILALRSDYKKIQSILDEITRNICVNSKYYTNVRADILDIGKTEDLCFSYEKRQSVFREKIHNLYERFPWAMLKTNTAVVLKNELGNYYLTKNIGNIIDQEILEYHLDLLSKRQFANSLHHKCSAINHKDYMILAPTSALFSFVNSALLVYFSHTDSIIYSPDNNQNDFSKLLYERIPESVFSEYHKDLIKKQQKKEVEIVDFSLPKARKGCHPKIEIAILETDQKIKFVVKESLN